MTQDGFSRDLLEGGGHRSPPRALALHASSSIVLVLLLAAVVALAAQAAVDSNAAALGSGGSTAPTTLMVAPGAGRFVVESAQTYSDTVMALDRTVASIRGEIVELSVVDARGSQAGLVLRVELPDSSATTIERLISRMQADGVGEPRVESVIAMPRGSLLVVIGTVRVATGPRSAAGIVPEDADVSVRLAELTNAAEAELRRIDMSGADRDGSVKLIAAGSLASLASLLGRVEDGPSAPARIRSVRIDRAPNSGDHRLDITFLLRETPDIGAPRGASRTASDRPRP